MTYVEHDTIRPCDIADPITPGQLRAFHAKCNELAKATGRPAPDWKRDVKAAAERHFDQIFESTKDLSVSQASWCLDWLEARLA